MERPPRYLSPFASDNYPSKLPYLGHEEGRGDGEIERVGRRVAERENARQRLHVQLQVLILFYCKYIIYFQLCEDYSIQHNPPRN